MNYKCFVGFLIVFVLPLVSASNQVIYPISLGYNLSFHVTQISGKYAPVTFDNCVNTLSNTDWFCDIHNSPNFNLTFHSDNTYIYPERNYKITSSGAVCQASYFNDTRIVRDFGSFAYVSGGSLNLGQNVVQVPIYIYVNRTIYKNVSIPEYYNETIYVVNDSLVEEYKNKYYSQINYTDALEEKINNINLNNTKSIKLLNNKKNMWFSLTIIFSILFILSIIIMMLRDRS